MDKTMDKALWKGVVTFSDVKLPVKLYAAVRDERVTFHLLHDKDHLRLRQEYVCSQDDEPVPAEHRVKGYEIRKDHYVVIPLDELKALAPESDRTIHVHEFVHVSEIDPRFFSHPWLMGPDGDDNTFAVLTQALAKTGLAGICRWAMRGEAYLGAMVVSAGALGLVSLKYADEIAPVSKAAIKDVKLDKREVDIARYLIEQLSTEFKYDEYRDEFQDSLRELIEKKARGEKIKIVKTRVAKPTESDQLLALLEKSVKRTGRAAHA
jgi:DNA end-binding protein Ku